MEHVIAQLAPEDRHGQKRNRREVLRDVRGRGVAAQQPPVPSDDHPLLQQGDSVDGLLVQRCPVVLERDLRPGADRKTREQRGEQYGHAGPDTRRADSTVQRHCGADTPPRQPGDERQDYQGGGVPRFAPAVQRAGQFRPAAGREEIHPGEQQRKRERRERRPPGQPPST